MIGKGKSISHGVAALEYDLAKEINGQAVATEIARHELYGCTGAEMVQEMKPYHIDFPNVKNNCLRFEVSPSIEESATFTDADALADSLRAAAYDYDALYAFQSKYVENTKNNNAAILANFVLTLLQKKDSDS